MITTKCANMNCYNKNPKIEVCFLGVCAYYCKECAKKFIEDKDFKVRENEGM